MNATDYAELAAACDALLRSPDSSLGRVALPLLHLINEHPSLLRQYAPLLGTAAAADAAVASPVVARSGTTLRRALRALRRARRPLPPATQAPAALPGRTDVLIVSRLTSVAQLSAEDDFYFGALPRLLGERGAECVVALVDHLPPQQRLALNDPGSAGARVVLPRTLPAAAEVRLWATSVRTGRTLLRAARRADTPLQRALAELAGRQALAGVAMQNLRLHGAVARLCRQLQPRIVITTYEGDASERMIWHAAREHGRRPLCVGYQHTTVREHAHAIRRHIRAPGIACDPEIVLTLGEITEALLAHSAALQPVRLITYGSHRRATAGVVAPDAKQRASCLVLPDGDPREYQILFSFAIACARLQPEMMFRLRPHPMTQLDAATLVSMGDGELPANVLLSRDVALAEDCAQARYCLYRGSSAVLQAVLAGVKPFYLAQAGELSFDPLYALTGWRESLSTPAEFRARTSGAADSPDSRAALDAQRFCDRYVSPVRTQAIDALLALATTEVRAQALPRVAPP